MRVICHQCCVVITRHRPWAFIDFLGQQVVLDLFNRNLVKLVEDFSFELILKLDLLLRRLLHTRLEVLAVAGLHGHLKQHVHETTLRVIVSVVGIQHEVSEYINVANEKMAILDRDHIGEEYHIHTRSETQQVQKNQLNALLHLVVVEVGDLFVYHWIKEASAGRQCTKHSHLYQTKLLISKPVHLLGTLARGLIPIRIKCFGVAKDSARAAHTAAKRTLSERRCIFINCRLSEEKDDIEEVLAEELRGIGHHNCEQISRQRQLIV